MLGALCWAGFPIPSNSTHFYPMADPISTSPTLNITRLCGMIALCCIFGPLLGYGLGEMAVWGDGTAATLRPSAILAGVSWVFAAGVGLGLMIYASRGKVANLGFPVMAASIVRMFVALAAGLILFFTAKIEPRTFWASFLITGLAILMVETAWAMKTLTANQNLRTSDGVR